MNDEEKIEVFNRGVEEGLRHRTPSPETDRRMSILEMGATDIKEDLKEIKLAITRSTIWLITTLFTILIASFSLAFWLGSWKGSIEEKINNLQKSHEKSSMDISNVEKSIRPISKEEVDNFARKNFNSYNK